MMLHSLRKRFRIATIALITSVPVPIIGADVSQADPISDQAIAEKEFESLRLGELAVKEHAIGHQQLQVSGAGDVSFGESVFQVVEENVESRLPTGRCEEDDRFWLINTRHLTSRARCVNLDDPELAIYRLHCSSRPSRVTFEQYIQTVADRRTTVVYVHGNRIRPDKAIDRGFAVYRNVNCSRTGNPIDWVIWSWPSEKSGILMRDARIKAARTDGQGLYLAWLLRRHAESQVSTTLIGYSFGGRIITGALHAVAGGKLRGRTVPGEPLTGGPFDAGLVAPAVDSHWLTSHGYHRLATKNLDQLVLLYNRRDAVLKRFWLIDRVRGRMALGYSGPTSFSDRFDGTRLPVRSRDCSSSIGLQHDELDYYNKSCRAGSEMAKLIDDIYVNH